MRPGTYRIVNLVSGTAITETRDGAVGWQLVDGKHQQWFAQRSGEGYRFQNVASGGYLAVASTNDHNNQLYCGGYPTTWMLFSNPEHRGKGVYAIIMGDTDRILDLNSWGGKADGTKITAFAQPEFTCSECRTWCFERISDETGEGPTETQLALVRAEKTIQNQAAEIEFLRKLLLDSREIRLPSYLNNTT
ncbi:hypothetical protein RSOLAG22IIIB_11004 [Rhizoctonia solani]|uniref:Ricin B lectin domain-containing protein n=1 Tax=Rhizoctonia solani TaxID=456999 RepID=A0A0K6G6R6_9AGAM|nr:hypothetical protein RSOLAG22IIIB_11004 [Rhizoctonia solani]